jgi:hypothetical protein
MHTSLRTSLALSLSLSLSLSLFMIVLVAGGCGGRALPAGEVDSAPSADGGGGVVPGDAGPALAEGSIPRADSGHPAPGSVTITLDKTTADVQGSLNGTLHNQTAASIFVGGCGLFDRQLFENGAWKSKGSSVDCFDDPGLQEVSSGTSLKQAEYFETIGTWRLAVHYGAGCPKSGLLDLSQCKVQGMAVSPTIKVVATQSYCAQLASSYKQGVPKAKGCKNAMAGQCQKMAASDLICGCPTFVNDSTSLVSLQQLWSAAGCGSFYLPCTGICMTPVFSYCYNNACLDDYGDAWLE